MSTSLRWAPIGDGNNVNDDGDPTLKDAIRREFGGGRMRLDQEALAFLRGLVAARVPGADSLIEVLRRHGTIEVWEES